MQKAPFAHTDKVVWFAFPFGHASVHLPVAWDWQFHKGAGGDMHIQTPGNISKKHEFTEH